MPTKSQPFLIVALVALAAAAEPALAEHYRIRPKCRSEARLASELVLVRHAKSCYRGMCRNGQAIYDVTAGQEQAVRSMAAGIARQNAVPEPRSNRLLISYANQNDKPSNQTMAAAGLKVIQDYESGSFLVVEPQDGVTAEAIDTLLADDAVAYVAPDYIMSIPKGEAAAEALNTGTASVPNDPNLNKLWGMQNSGAAQVWPQTRDSANVVVAVIDTGVDYRHPDLRDNMWSRGGIHGYDFYDNDSDPLDEENHGTHVAGTIAAVGNNGVGVVGVTWKTQIMAMRFLGPDGGGATSDAVKCIDWAVANGAHVLCNSWAGPATSPELSEAVSRAERKGVLFVAAAGNTGGSGNNNDSRPYYPASLGQANVISVGAIDSNNNRGSFSHYGKRSVDIGAPGVQILSTVRNGQYATQSGTSMAAPHVAGAAVLVWATKFSTPTQSPSQMTAVRDLLYENARPVPALKDFWGHSAPAKIAGGVLDLTFLSTVPPVVVPPDSEPPTTAPRQRLVENRMIVDPARLR